MESQELLATPETEPIQEVVERGIARRTWGRVHHLRVDKDHDDIVITGYAFSYHTKQLALHAVLDVLGSTNAGFHLDIEVGESRPRLE